MAAHAPGEPERCARCGCAEFLPSPKRRNLCAHCFHDHASTRRISVTTRGHFVLTPSHAAWGSSHPPTTPLTPMAAATAGVGSRKGTPPRTTSPSAASSAALGRRSSSGSAKATPKATPKAKSKAPSTSPAATKKPGSKPAPVGRSRSLAHVESIAKQHNTEPEKGPTKTESPKDRRTLVAEEVLLTERSYVKSLELVSEVYLHPIRDQALLTPEEVQLVFSNLETIVSVNKTLLEDLEKRLDPTTWSSSTGCVGDVILTMAPWLKMYTTYCKGYDNAVQFLTHTPNKRAKFRRFLQECREDPRCGNLNLSAFLVMPVQRIPRYILLLEQLVKCTHPEHEDYKNLAEALDKMREVANHVNETLRTMYKIEHLIELDSRFIGDHESIVDTNRRFVREGILTKISRRAKQERMFLLFNDLIVYGTVVGEYKYRSRGRIELLERVEPKAGLGDLKMDSTPSMIAWIHDVTDEESMSDLGLKNVFQIAAPRKTYTLVAKSPEEKSEWMEDIQAVLDQTIEEFSGLKDHKAPLRQVKRAGLFSPPQLAGNGSGP